MATYQIYELSARAVMSYAAEQDGVYTFALSRSATEHCKVPGAKHEQDSCAMFHQLMYQLHGKGWREARRRSLPSLMCCSIWTSPESLTGVEPEGHSRLAGKRPEICSAPRGSHWTLAAAHTAMWLLNAPPA